MSDRAIPGAIPGDATGPSNRPPFMWAGDHVALDFLNSTTAPRGTPIEWIANGQDLVAWMIDAKVLDPAAAEHIRARFPARELDRVAAEAIVLREWFRAVLARAKARGVASLPHADIERLNTVLARDATYRRIESEGEGAGLRLVAGRAWHKPGDLLVPLAAAMADLLCDADLDLVRNCENPPCTMWFYDRTKGHRRRWCSQAVCGNRAKVAAFRGRLKQKR